MSVRLPTSFPGLPPPPSDISWTGDIHKSYDILRKTYLGALELLGQDSDQCRLKFRIDAITTSTISILQALESTGDVSSQLPEPWLHDIARLFGMVVKHLQSAYESSKGR
jgi:hypothetical protein